MIVRCNKDVRKKGNYLIVIFTGLGKLYPEAISSIISANFILFNTVRLEIGLLSPVCFQWVLSIFFASNDPRVSAYSF
jgi:hypothetical protein